MRIDEAMYSSALPDLKHIFLVGDLKRPCPHHFIRDSRLEVVFCSYQVGDDGVFHWHPEVTEYEFVVEGEVGYFETGGTGTQ